jgi:hypothetical protein
MQRAALVLLATILLAGVAGAATITGTARADRLTGTPRADRIDGRAGDDRLLGLGGADLLIGGPGRDRIDGGRGDDSVPAHGDETRDRIVCGTGRDVVTADVTDVVGKDCEVVSRQISRDGTTDPIGQHATEVEPDSFAFGSTIVSAFQVGRVSDGGAVAIGFATSVNSGSTWQSGLLPGVTRSSPRPGVADRASDPVVAYDAEHRTWLAVTLVISPTTGSFHLDVNRSPDGLSWTAPIHAVTGGDGDLDKEWVSCDNGATSPSRGRCYISYFDIPSGELRTTHSDDGGATWTAPVASTPRPPRGYDFNGAQPLIQPSGALVLVYTAFADPTTGARSEIQATISTDGGTTWSTPTQVAAFELGTIPGVRTFALVSAETDASGRMYVAWEGCRAGTACGSRRILLSTSVDGVSWTPAATITPGAATVSHFLPGLGVDPTANGRLTLVYHAIPNGCVDNPRCPGIDVFTKSSGDGGASWSAPQRLTAEPIALDWIAHTSLGLMLADYVSTSYVRGRPVSVFVLAAQRSGTRFRQSVFAHRS